MATYKLIKKYPGLPSDWEIGMEITENMKYGYFSAVDSKYSNYFIANNNDMENTPEFWQKVEELEYEILKSIDSRLTNTYIIISVKRLSDNVIFSIGDLCNPIGEYSNNKHKITEIWFTNSGDLRISSDNYCLDINHIEHSKKVLFVTEDGVEIFKGDTYTVMFYDWELLEQEAITNYKLDNATLRFSTKEKAEEYVLYNKTMFSLQEILDIRAQYMDGKNNISFNSLVINKAKEK